jgi:hypothetical protein
VIKPSLYVKIFVFLFFFFNLFLFRGEYYLPVLGKNISINILFIFFSYLSLFLLKKEFLKTCFKDFIETKFHILGVLALLSIVPISDGILHGSFKFNYFVNYMKAAWILPFAYIFMRQEIKSLAIGICLACLSGTILIAYPSVMYFLKTGQGIGRNLVLGVPTDIVKEFFLIPSVYFSGEQEYVKKAFFVLDSLGCNYLIFGFVTFDYLYLSRNKAGPKKLEMIYTIGWLLVNLAGFIVILSNQYFSLVLLFLLTKIFLFIFSFFIKGPWYEKIIFICSIALCFTISKINWGAKGHEVDMYKNRLRVVRLYKDLDYCKKQELNCNDDHIKRRLSDGNRLSLFFSALSENKNNLVFGVGLPLRYGDFRHDGDSEKVFTGHSFVLDMIISVGLFFGVLGGGVFLFNIVLVFAFCFKAGKAFLGSPESYLWLGVATSQFLLGTLTIYGFGVMDKSLGALFLVCQVLFFRTRKGDSHTDNSFLSTEHLA